MEEVVKGQVSINKTYLRKERDQLYHNWNMAFWRELFQNSVDAGAKRITIDLKDVPARGTMGNPGSADGTVTNVVFADDGEGMSGDTIADIYFKMGMSSKDAADSKTIGGFGRARIMTCFAQERFTILSRDRFVMGDGPKFEHGSIGAQLVELEKYAAELERSTDPGAAVSLAGIEADMELLRTTWTKRGGYKGCRIEVDLDPTPPNNYYSLPGTVENMSGALRKYMAESQLPCEVVINGKSPEDFFGVTDGKLQARKGPVRRTLKAEGPNGIHPFATVHLSEGKKAALKGKMIVRVAGASMYAKDVTGLESQVIVEIDPQRSRDALNSNRDGLKGDFAKEVDKLLADLTVDTLTALKDKSTKIQEIDGEKGRITTSPPKFEGTVEDSFTSEELEYVQRSAPKTPKLSSFEALRDMGLHQDILAAFLQKANWGGTFMNAYLSDNWGNRDELHRQLENLRDGLYSERRKPQWFFDNAGDLAKAWVLSGLSMRVEKARAAWKAEQDTRVKGVHDIYISMESTNSRTKAAARRHHPDNWDVETGNGKAMRSLLAVWTEACHVALETLYLVRPSIHEISWTTGFIYSLPEETHQGDQYRNVATGAQCVYVNSNDLRMLINPVNDDGTLRYSVTNRKDLQRILALAKHEVSHVVENYHNETFANILTDIDMEIDTDTAYRRMKASAAAVTAAYAEGKARVHRLDGIDGADGLRPAERLLALACGNDVEAAREAMEYAGATTREIDTDEAFARAAEFDGEQEEITAGPRFASGR